MKIYAINAYTKKNCLNMTQQKKKEHIAKTWTTVNQQKENISLWFDIFDEIKTQ